MMMTLTSFLLLSFALLCSLVKGSDSSYSVSVQRDHADAHTEHMFSRLRQRKTGQLPTQLGKSLYWFGNFSVGDASSLKLLIDTGSTDILLNNGEYVVPILFIFQVYKRLNDFVDTSLRRVRSATPKMVSLLVTKASIERVSDTRRSVRPFPSYQILSVAMLS